MGFENSVNGIFGEEVLYVLEEHLLTCASVSSHEPILGTLGQVVQNGQKVVQVLGGEPVAVVGLQSPDRPGVTVAAFSGAALAGLGTDLAHLLNVRNLELCI